MPQMMLLSTVDIKDCLQMALSLELLNTGVYVLIEPQLCSLVELFIANVARSMFSIQSITLLRNHIQLERSGTDRFFSYYHFIYIYGLFHCIFKIFH